MTEAERYLASLEPVGLRLGLDRMRALVAELGEPQESFASVHVVGTNGKTSVARMTEAILGEHGVRAGCSLSPHLRRWRERVTIAGREIDEAAFERAVAEAAAATARVEERAGTGEGAGGELEAGERLTQFEVATAASFLALAEAGVEVAVIEAGLGGRLDATNVVTSTLTVLTTVGLDHTDWLGPTELDVAAEKLAVLEPGTALLTGRLDPEVADLAARTAGERSAALLEVPRGAAAAEGSGERTASAPGEPDAAAGRAPDPARGRSGFQRENLALAEAAAAYVLGRRPDREAVLRAGGLQLPGRLEQVPGSPPLLLDVAHNAQGAAALAGALEEVAGGQPVIACVALLADKDAAAIAGALAPSLAGAVATEVSVPEGGGSIRPGAEPLPAARLADSFAAAGLEAETVPDATAAIERARGRARELGGTVLVAGSHRLVAVAREAALCDD